MCLYCVFTIHSKMYNVYNVLNSEYNTEHVNIAGSHKNGCYLLKLCKIWRYIIKEEYIVTKIENTIGTKTNQPVKSPTFSGKLIISD